MLRFDFVDSLIGILVLSWNTSTCNVCHVIQEIVKKKKRDRNVRFCENVRLSLFGVRWRKICQVNNPCFLQAAVLWIPVLGDVL